MTMSSAPSADTNTVLDIVLDSSGAHYKNNLKQYAILQAAWMATTQENVSLKEQIASLQSALAQLSPAPVEPEKG